MSKEIWLGPVLSNNRERLLARCAEYIARGESERLLYIAASSPLLNLVTEKLLDGKNAKGVWGDFPVYLFRGFVRRILAEAVMSEPGAAAIGSKSYFRESNDPVATAGSDTSGLQTRIPIDRDELPLRKSLISQIIRQLSAAGELKAIKPLANRDGCVNTIAALIGELQRAGKTAHEFRKAIEEREQTANPVQSPKSKDQSPRSQIDFDREVALIYEMYSAALDRNGLTDEDADQLRALQIVRGESNGKFVCVPWLEGIETLVLDGFFDFTPVQGEILKHVIPRIANVIVNVNHDDLNPQIFRPFQSTIEHLQSIAPFEIKRGLPSASAEASPRLREKLFNVIEAADTPASPAEDAGDTRHSLPRAFLIECADRELEIRTIAKEIKRLLLTGDYTFSDVALVVRERASYGETILRVLAAESIPCNLERRTEVVHAPAVRACGKLLQLLQEPREHVKNPKASDLAHLIKTGYFRPTADSLAELAKAFDATYGSLLINDGQDWSPEERRTKLGIGRWRPDNLENVIAYVGSELRINAWVDRARKIIKVFPSPDSVQSLINGDEADDPAAAAADEAPPEDSAVMDRRQKPAPIHPAAIGWSILVMQHLQQLLGATPDEGSPEELRGALMLLLEQLEFARKINQPFNRRSDPAELPQAALDIRGRESLRRAIAAAVRSFAYAADVVSEARPSGKAISTSISCADEPSLIDQPLLTGELSASIPLASFIDEVARALRSQVLAFGAANRDGLRVFEATDIRGLRFRAVFIAGMIEGGFPLRMSRDWLYPHEERVRLQKHGVFLEDISTETLLKEEHYFYQAACRATERLYLTRPLTLADGTETVASYYIDELRRAIKPNQIEEKQIRGDVDGHDLAEISTPNELATLLVRQEELSGRHPGIGKREPEAIADLIAQAHERAYLSQSALARVRIEQKRNSNSFGAYDGEITNAPLRQMLARHFGPEHVYSASRLSSYGNCAYRFFANRVIRLEPRSEAALDLQAIDAGKLLHDVLRRFFEKHRRDYLPAHDREQLRAELASTADAVFKEHEDKVPPLNDRIWKIDCEIRKLILDQVLLYELKLQERTDARGMRPAYFELAFGRASQASDPDSRTEFLKFARPGETVSIQGQIDRVDVNLKDRVAIAYDYKLSQGAGLEDIKSGRQVQIPIYLAALEQLFLPGFELAGGGYYSLRAKGPRLNRGLYRTTFADCTSISSRLTKFDDVEWQSIRDNVAKRVWEFIDGMRGGHFRVKPSLGRTTCKYCDYAALCRYDAHRINRKN